MAQFNSAYQVVILGNEGGYAFVPGDKGGETYRGIARNYWPSWNGWSYIDSYKADNGSISHGTVFPELESSVQQFYINNFWSKIQGDQIQNQQLANAVFDFDVESGRAMSQINQALGLNDVNYMTSDTLNALNADPVAAFNEIQSQRLNYYTNLNDDGIISDNLIEGVLARVKALASPLAISVISLGVIAAALFFF